MNIFDMFFKMSIRGKNLFTYITLRLTLMSKIYFCNRFFALKIRTFGIYGFNGLTLPEINSWEDFFIAVFDAS